MKKYLLFIAAFIVNVFWIFLMGSREILPLPFGEFLSIQEGIWQNAEPKNESFSADLNLNGLQGKVEVYFDDRLVPHVFADQENDAYFVQGYLHAKFRLWQMEFQTHAAAGRISEIVGKKALEFDRNQRRIGMVYAAENALASMQQDEQTIQALDAYTNGVNAYISRLEKSKLPVEYKLLGYVPEKWTNLKSALFTKQMTQTLAGYDHDFEYTRALKLLGEDNFRLLYDVIPDSLMPVIPTGTAFGNSMADINPPADADSMYWGRKDTVMIADEFKPNPSNGSNNWAVSGTKTKSGKPILANDPHLGLTLPSIWYEIQLHTPAYNAYGVSFPGLPGVVIGFNDSIAFGFTNAGRDVKDYYEIRFKDKKKQEYWFDRTWKKTTQRVEKFSMKNEAPFLDTVAYTLFGPVTYDHAFKNELSPEKSYALRWVAHDSSNILKMWLQLNRASDYDDYLDAISHFNVPGQNMIFASNSGDISIWQQADFPLRWKGQGLFVMPGFDSSYLWKGYIPKDENPHIYNPEQGFVSSANQRPVDSTYPYYIPGSYEVYRPITINKKLSELQQISVMDMMQLQNNNYNAFAADARPILLSNLDSAGLTKKQFEYLTLLSKWNLYNNSNEKAVVVFNAWWDSLQTFVFHDDLNKFGKPIISPEKFILLEALKKDTAYKFIDNSETFLKENLRDAVTNAFRYASIRLEELEKEGKLEWTKYKNTTVYHLLKNNAMPFARSGLNTGGGHGIVNAIQHDHGPSWRMVVELTSPANAYAIYPGGQSGNPGSRFYDSFIDTWAKGEYYKLWVMKDNDRKDAKVKWKMTFKPA